MEHLEARDVPATFTVNNPFDIAVPGLMNLRQAITQANGAAGADTIQFAAALYLLGNTAPAPLNDTLPTITDDLTIDGTSGVPGQRVTVMPLPTTPLEEGQEGPKFRLFQVATPAAVLPLLVNVVFNALTISGGNATNPADPNGGGIAMANAHVTLDKCVVTGNRAVGNGGGLYSTGNPSILTLKNNSVVANNNAGQNGGGIAVTNTNLELNSGTLVTGNRAGLGGGGIAAFADGFVGAFGMAFVNLDGSQGLVQVNDNEAMHGDGGGVLMRVLNAGALPFVEFHNSTVSGNTARGTAPEPGADWESGRGGGGVAIGRLSVDSDTNTIVTGNKQSAPAPATAPLKLGVYFDPAVSILSTFPANANVFDNVQLL